MKTKIENFTSMDTSALLDTNGGGFAFDVGRVLRFFLISGPSGINAPYALADWQVNALINDAVNG